MSTFVFHILDAISQDVEIARETETAREVIPRNTGDLTDDDEEVMPARRSATATAAAKEAGGGPSSNPANMQMNIYLFGSTAEGKPVRACVEGFRPFFFVRLPAATEKVKADFKTRLADALGRSKRWLRGVVKVKFEMRKALYGYTGDRRFCFARLSVPSLTAFRALKRFFLDPETSKPHFELYAGEDALEVFEANLDPMLRFFHLRNIKPCGWVETDAEPEEGVGAQQLQLGWEELGPCASPPMAAAPFLMAAWDIECYSENGEFPLAKKGYDRLAKQLYAAADSPLAAAELIQAAAEDPGSPPEGMDGLRHRDGKAVDAVKLRTALSSEVFQQTLEGLLAKKEGLAPAVRDERVARIRGLLGGVLKSVLPLAGDPAIQIGVVLVRVGSAPQKHIFVLDTCEAVPGATVHAYRTEKEMIVGWAQAMEAWNPDILMGYNVFGFDERYLWDRATELRVTDHAAIQSLSRLCDMDKKLTLEEKFLSSSALGDNTMWMWSAWGRLQVDLFHYIKRSFSLPAYKLDYVCQHFMSGKLAGVDVGSSAADGGGTWTLKTKTTGDVVIGRYVVLLDETGDTAVEKLRIVGVDPGKGIVVDAPTGDDAADLRAASADAVKWAVVKDDVSPKDIFTLHRGGGAAGRAKVAAYCVQDCDLTVELYKKLDVFNNAMAMANACSVPVSYIFTRGQGIKIESLIFKECYEREQCVVVLPTQPRGPPGGAAKAAGEDGEEAAAEESYEGAIVLTPTPGFYFESPVGVADFASLYPSTIISENISHDTLVWAKDYDMNGRLIGFSYGSEEGEVIGKGGKAVAWTDIEFDIWGTKEGDTRKNPEKEKKGLRVCRYAQFEGAAKGTLPDIVQKLLAARKAKRKEAEKESDPFKKALLDAEQLAYKLTANSLYGQLGSPTFKIRLQHLAASVTAYGRKQIMFAKAAIERFYGPAAGRTDCAAETVYGDTDSLFVNFNVRNPATGERLAGREAIVATMHLTEEAGKMVTTCLKAPHDFEYDKTMFPFIIFSKKRYVGNLYEESPDSYYQNGMGIATKRRDYAGIVKVIYGGAIRILLTQKDPLAAAEFVRGKLMDLAEGRASMTQLTMSKSLRSEYKAATPPAHKILAQRIAARDPGNAPASGDRISFLYVLPPVGQQASKSQGDRIETPAWIKEKGLEVDAKFYMEHQLMNPISQLFSLIVEQLPGCKAPGGRSWAAADAADREYAAAEYLFRDALNTCDRAAQRRLAVKMFGAGAVVTKQKGSVGAGGAAAAAPAPAPVQIQIPKQVQASITSLFAQQMLIKAMEKKKPSSRPSTPGGGASPKSTGSSQGSVASVPPVKLPAPAAAAAAAPKAKRAATAGGGRKPKAAVAKGTKVVEV
jgi:DNA polymerase elongation subunit (family B)